MPFDIDHETINVDSLPGIWSPVQWEMSEEDKAQELESQATASLLWSVDAPEAILRLLLNETSIERSFGPPSGYDPEIQGEWDESLVTFQFRRSIRPEIIERDTNSLYVEYDFQDLGHWALEIERDQVRIFRV
jgi:hypothetical protein